MAEGPEIDIPVSGESAVQRLPDFVEPMLARLEKQPFDSEQHLFEIKWDGIRALTFVEDGRHRMLSRRRNDMTERYPDLAFLAGLEPGTLLDGELVVLAPGPDGSGRPDFRAVMRREQARGRLKIEHAAAHYPASYVVFDILFQGFEPLFQRPLHARREVLRQLVEATDHPRLIQSDGVVGHGIATFEQMTAMGLEGMVAKRLDAPYLPGARTDAWIKVKTSRQLHCVILGYVLDQGGGLKSLIVGTNEDEDGRLTCVGKVGSGLSNAERAALLSRLRSSPRAEPLVATAEVGHWVEPELFCTVSYLERTPDGNLRAPVFEGLVGDAGA